MRLLLPHSNGNMVKTTSGCRSHDVDVLVGSLKRNLTMKSCHNCANTTTRRRRHVSRSTPYDVPVKLACSRPVTCNQELNHLFQQTTNFTSQTGNDNDIFNKSVVNFSGQNQKDEAFSGRQISRHLLQKCSKCFQRQCSCSDDDSSDSLDLLNKLLSEQTLIQEAVKRLQFKRKDFSDEGKDEDELGWNSHGHTTQYNSYETVLPTPFEHEVMC